MIPATPLPTGSTGPKLFVFDTHPIQYRSPVFRELAQRMPDLRVFFFNEVFDGRKWWFHERGKIPKQTWEIQLQSGFASTVLNTAQTGVLRFFRETDRLLRQERPSAILVYGYYLPEHWALWWLAQSHRIPLIFVGETFSRDGGGVRKLLRDVLQPLFFRGVRRFISVGDRTHAFYRSFGVDPSRITPTKYCVDTSFFQLPEKTSQATRRRVRQELQIPDNAFVLLFVGRLFERKRPLDMIEIQNRLAHLNVYTILVGNGPMESELKEKISGNPRIRAVGFKNQGETRDCYHASDLLVVPSVYETWGLVVNEANAAGIPALVTETCGTAGDLVISGETGEVIAVGDTRAAAQKIAELVSSEFRYQRLQKTAQKKVLTEYRIENFAEAIATAARLETSRR